MKALVTGVTGQDGYYLAEFLKAKGYEVHGLVRWSSRPRDIPKGVIAHTGDLTDPTSIERIAAEVKPDEVYNLAALTDIRASYDVPDATMAATWLGATDIMQAFPDARVFQASSAQMDGPSPYSKAKRKAHAKAAFLRRHGQYVATGILYNHESPRHSTNYLIPRIADHLRAYRAAPLVLHDVDSHRDWGWAPDYVEAMWLALQQDQPDDYEIGTGVLHSVEDVLAVAFGRYGLDWHEEVQVTGHGFDTKAANTTKARSVLGWHARTSFESMIENLIDE